MIFPTIHLNGTSKESLLAEYRVAYDKLDEAIEALSKVTIHGRDYYPQEQGAYITAREEQVARILKLATVKGELTDILLYLNEQG